MDDKDSLKPRSYQTQIENVAVNENTIIYLPTGSGKTFIAIQLMKRLQKSTIPKYSQGGKRTFFLVNNVPLVMQHCKTIKDLTTFTVVGFSGQDKVDLWKLEDWLQHMENNQVLVMTAQILSDMLRHNYVTLDRINLLIFDECHAAVKDHPMRQIMHNFKDTNVEDRPRVIGLTAPLLNKNVKPEKVEESIRQLETTFYAKVVTCNMIEDVEKFSTNPNEIVITYADYLMNDMDVKMKETLDLCLERLQHIIFSDSESPSKSISPDHKRLIEPRSKIANKLSRTIKSVQRGIDQLGSYGADLSILTLMIKLERIKLKADSVLVTTIQYILNLLTHVRFQYGIFMIAENEKERIHKYSSSKLKTLINCLKEYSPKSLNSATPKYVNKSNNELCGIIFVKERITALIVNMYLKRVVNEMEDEFKFLQHDFIVGRTASPYDSTREELFQQKQNSIIINEFRFGKKNLLICTDLLEEGFDLPACNLIIRFDELITFRSYIQSKGRGRNSTASYTVLVPKKDQTKVSEILKLYYNVSEVMNNVLIGKTDDRSVPDEEDIIKSFESVIIPYQHKNASITGVSAISLLNRYCMSLDNDIYTDPQPIWFTKKSDRRIVSVQLPTNSPLKTIIQSPPMSQLKMSKQAAALLMCKELHKIGELNDNLLPVDRMKSAFETKSIQKLFKEPPAENFPSDSSNKTKFYKREFPSCFRRTNNFISENTYYLHVIKTKAVRESCETDNVAIYDMLDSDWGYGLITKNKMMNLCDFSLFLSAGEVIVDIEYNIVCFVSNALLEKIKKFHVMLFYDVLDVFLPFLSLDNQGDNNYFFVVPVVKPNSYEIDVSSLDKYTTIEECVEPSIESRRKLHLNKDDYFQTIVAPWYRENDTPSRYIVTQVCEHMTPNSKFDNPDYSTYVDYFRQKYKLQLYGPSNQFMLKVKQIGGKMNCLMPRSVTIEYGSLNEHISKRKLKSIADYTASEATNQDELLVPEYCVRFSFPGVLWLKAILLPCAIHRITMLHQAEELRRKISLEINLGCIELENGVTWNSLKVDIHAVQLFRKNIIDEKNNNTDTDTDVLDEPMDKIEPIKENALDVEFLNTNIDIEYPWDAKTEPKDIDRNMDNVTLMDIECFNNFVSEKLISQEKVVSPIHAPRAICPPPQKYNDIIGILQKKINPIGPQLSSILEALTLSKTNDIINLERLEILGDSFLKYSVSLYLWHNYPKFSEGQLTMIKGKIVSNKNLYNCALSINLPGRMKTKLFKARGWLLPAFCIPPKVKEILLSNKVYFSRIYSVAIPREEVVNGKLSSATINEYDDLYESDSEDTYNFYDSEMEMYIGDVGTHDKTISDSVEALIGAYLLDSGIEAAFKILSWLEILPKNQNFKELLNSHIVTSFNSKKCSQLDIDTNLDYNQKRIEDILGYNFTDASLLLQALSHPSNIKNNITDCYQRLEFIGDAILDFLITMYIYENCDNMSPGDITDLRSSLVNNVTFACIIVKLGLHKFIQSSNTALDVAILKFVKTQENKKHEINDSITFLLEEGDCVIADYVDVPKALGDIFESLAGAVYLDSGNDLNTVWKVFYNLLYNEIHQFMQNIPKQPVRMLYEQTQSAPKFSESSVLENGRVMVPLKFYVNGKIKTVHGFGFNTKNAKRSAAKIALKILKVNNSQIIGF